MYSKDKNIQILTYLLKAHGISNVVASPGMCEAAFVAGIQNDDFFKVYSCVDERSAAYLAVGIAEKTGNPVVITCTEATASRNYMSALTEAFYRKLPILAITFGHGEYPIGNLGQQSIDRSQLPKDIALLSVNIRNGETDFNILKINKAILELSHRGGGPVHINIPSGSMELNIAELPAVRVINRYTYGQVLPQIQPKIKVGVLCMCHKKMSSSLTNSIDRFCEQYNAVVLCDHTSGYYGKYKVNFSLLLSQKNYTTDLIYFDLLIHIGEVCAIGISPKETWRVNEDGELRDKFHTLTKVFEMSEEFFFNSYLKEDSKKENSQYSFWEKEYNEIYNSIPELPLSNIWCAYQLSNKIPRVCTIHFSILNSLRSWNFFKLPNTVTTNSNVGGFGIDGCLSTLIGASIVDESQLHYIIIGDLSFFYDMNSLGIRHIGKNLRILLINNGRGTEFRLPGHNASVLGESADLFVAAAGHYGSKSQDLVRHISEDLGFKYLSANNKNEFNSNIDIFCNETYEKSIVFEVFTDTLDENTALSKITNIKLSYKRIFKDNIKYHISKVIGKKNISILKRTFYK